MIYVCFLVGSFHTSAKGQLKDLLGSYSKHDLSELQNYQYYNINAALCVCYSQPFSNQSSWKWRIIVVSSQYLGVLIWWEVVLDLKSLRAAGVVSIRCGWCKLQHSVKRLSHIATENSCHCGEREWKNGKFLVCSRPSWDLPHAAHERTWEAFYAFMHILSKSVHSFTHLPFTT